MPEKRPALGKGLSALIPDVPEPRPAAAIEADVDRLVPGRFQPRTHVDHARLTELAESIKTNGLIQPIIVRRDGADFQIIAGERRWRAAQLAGLQRVPIVVREVPDEDEGRLLQLALIENIQREDLNPIEEAGAYRRLADEFHLTQDQIAQAVGKDRATIANVMRLLKLPESVRHDVAADRLSMGHARALLSIPDPAAINRVAREVVDRGLSVRQTETLVRKTIVGMARPRAAQQADVHTRAAQEELSRALGTRVRIVRRRKGGTIEVDFTSEDELQRLYEALGGK
jgi:ParB family chromosome partitioning protein